MALGAAGDGPLFLACHHQLLQAVHQFFVAERGPIEVSRGMETALTREGSHRRGADGQRAQELSFAKQLESANLPKIVNGR